jgi:riboflavin biosynthesis pyrimidine reductase
MDVVGPGSPFTVLFDDDATDGTPLPDELAAVYGQWRLPSGEETPVVSVNFVISRDGRISFDEPGHAGGGAVSGFDGHDRWLMGLLRARADMTVVGAGTWRAEPDHRWTPEFIEPRDAPAWAALRAAEGRRPDVAQAFVTASGRIPPEAAVFEPPALDVVVATTAAGSAEARRRVGGRAEVVVLEGDDGRVDMARLVGWLHRERGARSLLTEGGPHFYCSLLAAGIVCDEFLTLSPVVAGNRPDGPARPGLVEGVAFPPDAPARSRPVSLRRAGDHLYLRSRAAR